MIRHARATVRVSRACERRTPLRTSRRHTSDEAKPTTQPAKPTSAAPKEEQQPLTIPGPSWLQTTIQPLAIPFRAYGRASKNRPYVTQVTSSLVIYFLGDLASQYIRQRGEHPDGPAEALANNYDTNRTVRALIIGGISSIPSYHWFMYLSTHFNVPATWAWSKVLSLAYKVAVNQALFTPLFNSYFFGMQALLSGEGAPHHPSSASFSSSSATLIERLALQARLSAMYERIAETVPTSWYNSCKFWPFVTAFSFTFIPMRQRSPFAGVAAIGWQSYLGVLNQRAVERERREIEARAVAGG